MDKYLQLMQAYDQFKRATGFSGDLETAPKDNTDWEKLIQDRPQCSLELQHLKNKGGFPHVELCSLIAGDKSSDGMKPASLSEFLVTGSLQRLGAKDELNTESINAVATAQASLSADALAHLLPATMTPPPSSGKYVQPDPAEVAATTPAVLTQDLHDNMNMFLKTATAYLVMMINDHNHQNDK